MALQRPTKEFLSFLRNSATLRDQIRAAPNAALFYAGSFFKPFWEELEDLKARRPELARKETLVDVLARIPVTDTTYRNLSEYVQAVDRQIRPTPDRFILWRALSGIYARNAVGKVSFQVGSEITRAGKVFAATEVANLLRNPSVDETSRDFLEYVQRCIDTGDGLVNAGFISL